MNDNYPQEHFQRDYCRFRDEVTPGLRWDGPVIVGHQHDEKALDEWLSKLCHYYLTCEPQARAWIRETFADANLLWQLNGFPLVLCRHIRTPSDIEAAKMAIAALAIVDQRVDDREYSNSLRKVYYVSEKAGVPIKALLREVAILAGASSLPTRELFMAWAK